MIYWAWKQRERRTSASPPWNNTWERNTTFFPRAGGAVRTSGVCRPCRSVFEQWTSTPHPGIWKRYQDACRLPTPPTPTPYTPPPNTEELVQKSWHFLSTSFHAGSLDVHASLLQIYETGSIAVPIVQMSMLRLREDKVTRVQGHLLESGRDG